MFSIINKDGNIIWEKNENKTSYYISDVYRAGEIVYMIKSNDVNTYLAEYNGQTFKRNNIRKLENVKTAWYDQGKMYGYIKKAKQKKKFFIADTQGNIQWKGTLPKGKKTLYLSKEEEEDGVGYSKCNMWNYGKYFYYSNINGIYRLDMTAKNTKFKMFLQAKRDKYLKGNWSIVDIKMWKNKLIYLMIDAPDDEGPSHLVEQTLSKG